MLKADKIAKSYGETPVLHKVDLGIERGKITALIGPSGSGKTTLLKVLAFLEHPDSGSVSLDEVHYQFPLTKDKKIKAPWPKVSVVFQQLFLWPHLTLLQNITLPLMAKGLDDKPANLRDLLDRFDMNDFVYRYPNQASLGQRQRAALVRALLLKPDYLLLDEITSSLDVEQTAKDAADKIVFMERGEILEEGSPELLSNPQHERLRKFLSVLKVVS
jgi:ABC-type polar amino acid transport system ATPase subunit